MDVNSKQCKTHWCFTLADDPESVETTPTEGVSVVLDGQPCQVYLGPVEQGDEVVPHPHRHCMLSFKGKKRACTKGQALAYIREFLNNPGWNEYFKGLATSVDRYIRYAWKSVDPAKTVIEKTIKRAIEDVADSGMAVTAKRLRTHLTNTAGAHFTQKNKGTVDLMLQEVHLYQPSKNVPFQVEPDYNRQMAFRSFVIMNRLILNAIREHGYDSSHKDMMNLQPKEIANVITCLITLPYLCNRWEGGDGLPGLFFYGEPCTGKSHLFKSAPCYAKVAQDAAGVSRYKKTGAQSAYLLDDIKSSFLDDNINSGTLRQLILGDSVTVKIMGDTQDVLGWVVATSNEDPAYLHPETPPPDVKNWEIQCAAWRRRFVSVHFTSAVDLDPVIVNWHHASAKDAAVAVYMAAEDECPDNIREKLRPYTEHISRTLEEDWQAPIMMYANEEDEWINEHVPDWEKPDAFKMMMGKFVFN